MGISILFDDIYIYIYIYIERERERERDGLIYRKCNPSEELLLYFGTCMSSSQSKGNKSVKKYPSFSCVLSDIAHQEIKNTIFYTNSLFLRGSHFTL